MGGGKGDSIAGNRFFVKNRKVLYGEKTFFGSVYDLYLYRLDIKTSTYKPIQSENAVSPSTLRRKLKDGSIKLLPY